MTEQRNIQTIRNYELKNYGRKSAFSGFLPGIAGIHGIPIWCYYVNRGQGVVSFGVDNKDHAIMEYYPAHVAYQNVKRTGFRTFIRKDGLFFEPFEDEAQDQTMEIGMNRLQITERNAAQGIQTDVTYTILPEEKVGALIRKVTIRNTGDRAVELEIVDGMPALIPYGIGMDSMKNMTQTAKAWMQADTVPISENDKIPFFRVRVSMEDSAEVSEIEGGNFGYAITESGQMLPVITDPEVLFDYDLSLGKPVRFREEGLEAVLKQRQNRTNLLPCCFFAASCHLQPGEAEIFYELIGQVHKADILQEFFAQPGSAFYFNEKIFRAQQLAEELTDRIATKTGNPVFDAYSRYTYMDNVLRGGYPIPLGHNKIFYVYSRKHGDLERDYNYFSMLPEFYSQGNGNFRDVNQNRRMDTFFSPFVKRENIHTFYSLQQLDGYNPLGVEMKTYRLSEQDAEIILSGSGSLERAHIRELVTKPFTPGKLYRLLSEILPEREIGQIFDSILDFSEETANGNFGEGYWSDHWDYNLDLIEEYLAVYPEKEAEMLYEKSYRFFLSQANILKRTDRYVITDKGVRQYRSLNKDTMRRTKEKYVRTSYGTGEILETTLAEKLILLSALKFATLDPYGMGIEMEGGKPGWYDALNGLPGMLGSSVNESCELARHLDYTIHALRRNPGTVEILTDLDNLIEELRTINDSEQEHLQQGGEQLSFWNRINDAKEAYREKTYAGISGDTVSRDSGELADILETWKRTVTIGIRKAVCIGGEICPAYFTYEMSLFRQNGEAIIPLHFTAHMLPYFLEGPVRYLKLPLAQEEKQSLYQAVKNSDLYDPVLQMYKVNASLESETYEIGRARAFTPGWLENESIWLHMEYKYLLELLKSEMYEDFFSDFHQAAIPFLKEEVYGRSILENSSFLASSRNPDSKIHGKGFVARLSGSTIEFMNMWKIMMFGRNPFSLQEKSLCLQFAPAIPAYLLDTEKTVIAKFLGKTDVIYHFDDRRDYYPGNYQVASIVLIGMDGTETMIRADRVTGRTAEEIRKGAYAEIHVSIR